MICQCFGQIPFCKSSYISIPILILLYWHVNIKKYNIETTLVDTSDLKAVRNAIKPNTKLIHIETPGNPTTRVSDIAAIAKLAKDAGALGGAVICNTELIDKIKQQAMVNLGGIISPFNAWLIMRGVVTLPLRMCQHSESALKIARFLEKNPAVKFVYYPGLESHPQHEIAKSRCQCIQA